MLQTNFYAKELPPINNTKQDIDSYPSSTRIKKSWRLHKYTDQRQKSKQKSYDALIQLHENIWKLIPIPLALKTKTGKTSWATKHSIRSTPSSSFMHPWFILIIEIWIIEFWLHGVVYFIIIRNCRVKSTLSIHGSYFSYYILKK